MSSRPPIQSAVYAKSKPPSAPSTVMAATQTQPLGPHALPPIHGIASPYVRLPPPPPLHLKPLMIPQSSPMQAEHPNYSSRHYSSDNTQQNYHTPAPQLPRPRAPGAAPLDRLLHPQPQTSSSSSSHYPATYHSRTSPPTPLDSRPQFRSYDRSFLEDYPKHHYVDSAGRYPLHETYSHHETPLQSPGYAIHRKSIGSQNSPATTHSGYSAEPARTSIPDLLMSSPPRMQNITSRYRVTVRQQPIAARACGFGERDRRVIDPPPIVQLSLTDFNPTSQSDLDELRWPFNVVHCILLSVPPLTSSSTLSADVTAIADPNNTQKLSRRLMGTLVASPFVGIDPDILPSANDNARIGCFFIFPDLSCRQNGLYKLRFTLMKIGMESIPTGGRTNVLGTVESDIFEVFSAKDFPGMRASTALTRELKRQGAAVSVKKGNEGKARQKGKKRHSSDSEGSGSDASDDGAEEPKSARKKKKN